MQQENTSPRASWLEVLTAGLQDYRLVYHIVHHTQPGRLSSVFKLLPLANTYSPGQLAEGHPSPRRGLVRQNSLSSPRDTPPRDNKIRVHRSLSMSESAESVLSQKVHFLRSLRERGFRKGRLVLVSGHKVPYAVVSLIPYSRISQHGYVSVPEGRRQRHPSGNRPLSYMTDTSVMAQLQGVELGDDGKTVSYAHFLVPTRSMEKRKSLDGLGPPVATQSQTYLRTVSYDPAHLLRVQASSEEPAVPLLPKYDPYLLDDPEWRSGKHRTVLNLPCYMTTIIDYAKPSELKKDLNEMFKERFPHIQLTLSKLRSLKREMKKIAVDDCRMEEVTVAQAYVYVEKLVLQGKINKQNRKYCAGACLLLAAKLNDTKKAQLAKLLEEIEDTFRLNRKDLIAFEFPVLVALEFSLHVPDTEVYPHYRRLVYLS
ncbi:CDK5 and ABL1 enzyme substrate 1-like isoform X1 [Branchiostoma floridae]|uniref:CDK5 and ABL1 enzyme substrate 1-like isoform X1 n=1 Tax=Branchiostoma floridae TaxID=7739 RepID=A0A9J7LGY5_BRAFL|nr:CDK5 and ABL1 enzyme substrate 1-like isoform X1 [Branchiostoma floridae]XP_035681534.1 CDK5 and ABL1 enzyme substrate 1-like isoform X1 [Branchiostoma floridae]XP_035681535.1 CDK5 and ABL1 enzyme substrate 1-like isoform X1 [Branchiostoma floridae]XP_035681536.1 CDK5 and ABL1 enzyme substrate 1-like isoform X1 [Branchiostoma floridae]